MSDQADKDWVPTWVLTLALVLAIFCYHLINLPAYRTLAIYQRRPRQS